MRRLLLPRERGILRYAELWQEGDELLCVHSSRFSDRYARYRLRDIQALVLTEFPLWNAWRASWLGLSVFFTLAVVLGAPGRWKLWAILPGLVLLWAVVHLARGPRCRLVLHTAVSMATLESVRTMRQARAVLPELRQLTEGVQGRLAPDGLTVTAMPPAPEPAAVTANTPLLLHLFFGVLVVHALALAGFYFGNKMSDGMGLSVTLLLAEALMAAMVAMRWRQAGPAVTIAATVIGVLTLADGGVLLYSAVKSLGGFFDALSRGGVKPEEVEWLWLKEQTVGRAAWHAGAGVIGWLLLLASRRSQP